MFTSLKLRIVVLAGICILLTLSLPRAVLGDPLTLDIMSWNVESGGSDLSTISTRIATFDGIDIWGLSEVQDTASVALFQTAAAVGENAQFSSVLGTTGGGDHLLIIYDSDRFDVIGTEELNSVNINNLVRAPLIAHFRDYATGLEFLFMVNQLYRTDDPARHQQAQMLNEWAFHQTLPVIAVGEYNFDYEVVDGDKHHDMGFDKLTANGVFKWVRPDTLVSTQCEAVSATTCKDQRVLDFVFVAGEAQGWTGTSQINVVPNDFPDDTLTSDHRPLQASFQVGNAVEATSEPTTEVTSEPTPEVTTTATPEVNLVTKQQLLDKIAELQKEIDNLRALVEQMP